MRLCLARARSGILSVAKWNTLKTDRWDKPRGGDT